MLIASASHPVEIASDSAAAPSYDAAVVRDAVRRVWPVLVQHVAANTADIDAAQRDAALALLAAMAADMAQARGVDGEHISRLLPADAEATAFARELLKANARDTAALPARALGDAYEAMLALRVVRDGGAIVIEADRRRRRATGSYFTPQPIVDLIVERTLGPAVDAHVDAVARRAAAQPHDSESLADALLALRVLDPAMGGGFFLLGAVDFLARRLTNALAARDLAAQPISAVRRAVAQRCVFGLDIDPTAGTVARASLALHVGGDRHTTDAIASHLIEGNALAVDGLADVSAARVRWALAAASIRASRFKAALPWSGTGRGRPRGGAGTPPGARGRGRCS